MCFKVVIRVAVCVITNSFCMETRRFFHPRCKTGMHRSIILINIWCIFNYCASFNGSQVILCTLSFVDNNNNLLTVQFIGDYKCVFL